MELTKEEIIEGNKLIAEFIKDDHYCLPEFHESWDWLMPVVEKIENYNESTVSIYKMVTVIRIWNLSETAFECRGKNKLEATYKAVLAFIKWYNEQNK